MKETTFFRLKLTTTKDKVFLSPFVFTEGQAKRRLKTSSWLVKKIRNANGEVIKSGKLEMVSVEKYPKDAVYNYGKVKDLTFISILERRWEDVNREDIKEVEEGSTKVDSRWTCGRYYRCYTDICS